MARLSDIIEEFIKDMLENTSGEELQIQRNELANHFSCAPSQINYVLTTRFTSDKGYYIESKRGGGGCIVIRRTIFEHHQSLLEVLLNKISESITYDKSVSILDGLSDIEILTKREAEIVKIALNDRVLGNVENKNKLRADILKALMIKIF